MDSHQVMMAGELLRRLVLPNGNFLEYTAESLISNINIAASYRSNKYVK